MTTSKKIHRVQVDFTEKGFASLQELCKMRGHTHHTETIQQALGLLWDYTQQEQEDNYEFE